VTRREPRRDIAIRSQLVGPILVYVDERGGDAAKLARRFALGDEAMRAPEVVLPLRTLQAFFEAAEVASRDPFLGLNVGVREPDGRWAAVEYGAKSAPDLRGALELLARYISLFNEHVVVTFEEDGGHGTISQAIQGRPLCIGRHGNEFFVASVLTRARRALGKRLVPQRVFFAHPRPADISALVELFGTSSLSFGAERNGFSVGRPDLDTPLATRDPALRALVEAYAEGELERRGRPAGGGVIAQVRHRVRVALPTGTPALAQIAKELKMSARSLQRRLGEHDTSFQAVVQGAREDLARTWVASGDRPLGEVAYALGYTELAPFVRAFRRWNGDTPAAFRARVLKAGKRT
jgi:AraC-like DNA-binding protein